MCRFERRLSSSFFVCVTQRAGPPLTALNLSSRCKCIYYLLSPFDFSVILWNVMHLHKRPVAKPLAIYFRSFQTNSNVECCFFLLLLLYSWVNLSAWLFLINVISMIATLEWPKFQMHIIRLYANHETRFWILIYFFSHTHGNIQRKIYVNIFINLHGFENGGIKIA